jgi:hypothetical protein
MNRKAPEGCSESKRWKPETWPKRPGAGSILPSVQFDCRHTFEIRPTAWKAAEGRAWDTDGTILSAMQLSRLVREAEVGRVGKRLVRRCVANLTDRCPAIQQPPTLAGEIDWRID